MREKESQVEKEQQERERKAREDNQRLAEFLKGQFQKPQTGLEAHVLKKHVLGGMMDEREARMNKELLREIAHFKKHGATKQSPTMQSPLK